MVDCEPCPCCFQQRFFGGEAALSSSRLGWMTTSSLVWLGAAETCLQMIQYYAVDCNWLRHLQASTHVNPGLCSTRDYERVRETLILCAAVSLNRLPKLEGWEGFRRTWQWRIVAVAVSASRFLLCMIVAHGCRPLVVGILCFVCLRDRRRREQCIVGADWLRPRVPRFDYGA
jgi:hypothetical protein